MNDFRIGRCAGGSPSTRCLAVVDARPRAGFSCDTVGWTMKLTSGFVWESGFYRGEALLRGFRTQGALRRCISPVPDNVRHGRRPLFESSNPVRLLSARGSAIRRSAKTERLPLETWKNLLIMVIRIERVLN